MQTQGDENLQRIFATQGSSGRHDLRGVVLYGLSEMLRSEQFARVIGSGDLDRAGELIRISHDGDRRVRYDAAGRMRRHVVRTDDVTLGRLAETGADLSLQCGRYACSTEAIVQLVDLADTTEGVVGSQLAGAGLGGCMMILVHNDSLKSLLTKLRAQFYRPRKLPFTAYVCTPVAGAGLLGA